MVRKAILTLHVVRDWVLDDDFYSISPSLKELTDDELLELLKAIWVENISTDSLVIDHMHGEITDNG